MKILFTIIITIALWVSGFSQEPSFITDKGEADKNIITIYPNPAKNFIALSILNLDLEDPQITVHNIIGSKMSVVAEKENKSLFSLDLRELPTGYYLLMIKDEQKKFNKTYKFLKTD